MAKYLGQASHGETGYTNQKAGDTANEVHIRTYYSYPWTHYIEPIDDDFGHKIANAMIDACNNDNIGYDMNDRNTAYPLWKKAGSIAKIKTKCEVDCTSLTALCVTEAGCDVLSGRSNAPYSGNTREILMATGKFKLVKEPTKRGTVLLAEGHHAAVYLGTTKTKKDLTKTETKTATKTETKTAKVETAKKSAGAFDKAIAGTYKTTANLHMRHGAGKTNASMCIIPEGAKVQNYGYYSLYGGKKWLYLEYKAKDKTYIGFSSAEYLKKS